MTDAVAPAGANTPGFPRRFEVRERIRFHHCDPAGIAFFARLDELLNSAFEDWCAAVGLPFALLMQRDRCGFPLVHASIDYTGILRMGDIILVGHHVRELGRTSITFDVSFMCFSWSSSFSCTCITYTYSSISLDNIKCYCL